MRYLILVVVGLVLAVGVAMMMKSKPAPQTPANDGERVLVAKVNLQPGTFIIAATQLDFVDMDSSQIKPNYLQKKNISLAEVDGAVVRHLIQAGSPVEKEKIVTPKEGGFLSAVLSPGTRAISVGVDVVSANAGFIFPGDKVDLLLTHSLDNDAGKKSFATETFVEDIRVLAIDQQVNNPEKKALVPKTVTLEVTPKQAEKILVAQELGKISLILRSSGSTTFNDVTSVKTETYTRDNEVSKILSNSPVNDKNIDVTITRGKTSTETKVGSGSALTPPVPAPTAPLPQQDSAPIQRAPGT